MKPVRTAARALLGAIFISGGARALTHPEILAPRAKPFTDRLAPVLSAVHPGLPTDARALVKLNGGTQLGAGLLLATGHLARPAAAVLAASLIPTTIAGHPFWSAGSQAERGQEQIQFFKNLGLLGGLLLAAADTQGRPSLRWRAVHAAGHTQRSIRRVGRAARREAKIATVTAGATRRLPW